MPPPIPPPPDRFYYALRHVARDPGFQGEQNKYTPAARPNSVALAETERVNCTAAHSFNRLGRDRLLGGGERSARGPALGKAEEALALARREHTHVMRDTALEHLGVSRAPHKVVRPNVLLCLLVERWRRVALAVPAVLQLRVEDTI